MNRRKVNAEEELSKLLQKELDQRIDEFWEDFRRNAVFKGISVYYEKPQA